MSSRFMKLRLFTAMTAVAAVAACSTDSTSETPASGSAPAAAVAAAPITFTCDGNAGGPLYSYISVTGQLSATGVPINVSVFPTYSPSNVGSFRKTAVAVEPYGNTPTFPRYKAWNVTGHANGVGSEGDLYYLVIPRVLPGPGGVVPGEVHLLFGGGAGGWWQSIGMCLIG